MWYNYEIQSFIFIQPPLKENGKQFPVNYLTSQGSFNFFFCSENGVLYKTKSYPDAVADMNKVFWQPDYLWWALGAGTITFFSVSALAASVRYWCIRRQDPARENAIPLVTMVATAAA